MATDSSVTSGKITAYSYDSLGRLEKLKNDYPYTSGTCSLAAVEHNHLQPGCELWVRRGDESEDLYDGVPWTNEYLSLRQAGQTQDLHRAHRTRLWNYLEYDYNGLGQKRYAKNKQRHAQL